MTDNKNLNNFEKIKCKFCNGEGGKDISVESNSSNFQWIDDGKYMELGWEDCPHCKGTGYINYIKKVENNG